MQVTNQQLEEISNFSSSLLELNEIATILGLNEFEFMEAANKKNEPIFNAIRKGRLLTKAGVNKSIVECAKAGSHPAQQVVLGMFRNLDHKEEDAL